MPELPEVETIRRGLAPLIEGRTLETLTIDDPRFCLPLTIAELGDAVAGRRVERLSRRGKYFVIELGDDVFLLLHLRMTGNLLYDTPADQPYRRATFAFDDGHELAFCDARRFGTAELAIGSEALRAFFAPRLGVEPLDEALFRAKIHPLRAAGKLTRAQCEVLAGTVQDALRAGLAAGGATIDDFRHPDGVYGAFQHEFLVHLRRGEPCGTCGSEIVKLVVGGRGTYVCERCQPRPRGLGARRVVAGA